ncbi:MAG: hypothetical protein OXI12_01795 [Gammaproteobacteria bacterium]|nr:hypothetical protein [Gammaproteobacteria bacterium]
MPEFKVTEKQANLILANYGDSLAGTPLEGLPGKAAAIDLADGEARAVAVLLGGLLAPDVEVGAEHRRTLPDLRRRLYALIEAVDGPEAVEAAKTAASPAEPATGSDGGAVGSSEPTVDIEGRRIRGEVRFFAVSSDGWEGGGPRGRGFATRGGARRAFEAYLRERADA